MITHLGRSSSYVCASCRFRDVPRGRDSSAESGQCCVSEGEVIACGGEASERLLGITNQCSRRTMADLPQGLPRRAADCAGRRWLRGTTGPEPSSEITNKDAWRWRCLLRPELKPADRCQVAIPVRRTPRAGPHSCRQLAATSPTEGLFYFAVANQGHTYTVYF